MARVQLEFSTAEEDLRKLCAQLWETDGRGSLPHPISDLAGARGILVRDLKSLVRAA